MPLIVDPDQLNQGVEVTINTTAKTIALNIAGNLSTDGVTLQCVYSFLKEEWKGDDLLIKFPFPMNAITEEKFEMISGWDWANTTTRELIRSGGWAVLNDGGVAVEEYAGVITLGTLGATDQVYYIQVAAGSSTNIVRQGVVNQAIKIYGDATHGSINYRSFLTLFVREQGKTYDDATLNDIGVTTMTYQVYRFPLTNAADPKITVADGVIDSTAPYTGMTIEWFVAAQPRTIGGTSYNFHVIIDGNAGTAEQIYMFVQRQLRKSTDIDAGSGTKIGKVTNLLLTFVGDTLYTLLDSTGGTYIDDFLPADTNRLVFTDDTNAQITFPFLATLTILFGDNLKNDPASIYRVFFYTDQAGTNAGYNFGTPNAITVWDAGSILMTGTVGGVASKQLTYAYDTNEQRGAGSAIEDAPVIVVGIGTTTAQYVIASGTITRSVANQVSLVAALERNYANP